MRRSHAAPVTGTQTSATGPTERERIWREGTTMVLYVAVVLLATLAALPAGHDEPGEPVHGPVGVELIAIVWGTTIGLALAHWFAFRVATQGFGQGHRGGQDFKEEMAQLAGACFVAVIASLPVVVMGQAAEQQAVPFVLALIIGGVGYLVERAHGRSRTSAGVFGVITLLVAVAVAILKLILTGH